MIPLILITIKGILRDRVFQGIMMIAVLFLAVPSISTLSMRQVSELSVTLSLSIISFILLLVSIFLGATSLWKDIERRYTFSVLGLPLSRVEFLLGKFAAIVAFLTFTAFVLGLLACAMIWFASTAYPPTRPVVWSSIVLAILFDLFKYTFLVGFAFLFSTVSTSFFLPIFGTIAVFLVGGATQQVYDFIRSAEKAFSPFVNQIVTGLYYLLPNFSAFDLKVHAVYGVPLSFSGIALTIGYFIIYLAILLSLSSIIFSRRELK